MAKSVELSQDIIDNIIAAGSDDTDLLKQCSLVSSSFLHPSRKLLFSRITIRSHETCQGIHQLLIQNPVVQTFVRSITLTDAMHSWNAIPEWINSTSLLDILRLPFCCLESFSIVIFDDDEDAMTFWITEPTASDIFDSELWDWNLFNNEMKDALSNIILLPTLKTICLDGIINVPTTFFSRITHLTALELHSFSPNHFCDSSTLTGAASKGVAPTTSSSHTAIIDRCVWRYGEQHAHRPLALIFLPFLSHIRFLEIHLDLSSGDRRDDFKILSFLMGSLSISLTSPEHLEFNIRFRASKHSKHAFNTFYENLRTAAGWSDLDSIITTTTTTTHPAAANSSETSGLQRVDVNIKYRLYRERDDDGAEPDEDEVLKAVFSGLPLLRSKGILFVEFEAE